ncbi:hypothetical protein Tco_0773066 [Tanacetum coccineum]|uniref:Reverse transcriptase domain-containing protein n=1 Tax=Tanacetum coccineum TaxID=301880 RepID=A0ABQ4ZN64_9ASTR
MAGVYISYLKDANLRLPLPSFFNKILKHYRMHASQLRLFAVLKTAPDKKKYPQGMHVKNMKISKLKVKLFVTCGGAHSYRNCPATDGNVYRDNIQEYVSQAAAANFNQGNTSYRAPIANQIRPPGFPPVDLKGITTRSGVAYQGPTIPTTTSSPPKVVEHDTEVTKDTVPPTNNGSTKDVQPPVVQVQTQVPNSYPVVAYLVDFDADPRVPLILRRSFLKTGRALIDVYEDESNFFLEKKPLHSILIKLQDTSLIMMILTSGNPTPYYDPVISISSSTLTPFGDSDFLLEEVDSFLALEDDPTSPEVDHSYYDPEGDILLLEAFLNDESVLTPSHSSNDLT